MTIPHTVELTAVPVIALVVALSYTTPEVLQILAAVGVLIGVIGGVVVNILSTWRVEKKADARSVVLDDVAKKSSVIEGHVNSEATAFKARIDSLEKENQLLRGIASEEKIAVRLAAQAAAITEAVSAVAVPAPAAAPLAVAPVAASLESIDQNTEATAKNTARTEAVVKELKAKP